MAFRDYMYLDTGRLQDYVSGLDQGVIEEFTETTRSQLDKEGGAKLRAHILEAGGGGRSEEETTREQTVRITAQHMFSRVYEEMDNAGSIRIFDEDDPLALDLLRRREVVEITRSFEPSPLNDMIDSILGLMNVMKEMGFTEEVGDPETQQIVRALAMIFRGDEGNEEIPMVSRAEQGNASVVFLAKSKHILVDQDDFRGEMTVFGKVRKLG